MKKSWPLDSIPLAVVTQLAILGSTAHIPTLYPAVGAGAPGGCPSACAVAPTVVTAAESATTVHQITATMSLSSPGSAVAHGSARARSVTTSHPTSSTVSATQLSP